MENPIKIDDLGVPLFSETSITDSWVVVSQFCFAWNKSWNITSF